MKELTTFEDLVDKANQLELYSKLILQLNKDLALANIYKLIQEKFMDYLNLLYIIDISEEKIKQMDGNDTMKLSEEVMFLILKREWQKVYYRTLYSS